MATQTSPLGKLAVQQNLQGHLEFLRKYPPFNQMDTAHLAFLLEQARLVFHAAGEVIVSPEQGPVSHFHIVKQGRVVGARQQGIAEENTFEISTGECFPLAALLGLSLIHI